MKEQQYLQPSILIIASLRSISLSLKWINYIEHVFILMQPINRQMRLESMIPVFQNTRGITRQLLPTIVLATENMVLIDELCWMLNEVLWSVIILCFSNAVRLDLLLMWSNCSVCWYSSLSMFCYYNDFVLEVRYSVLIKIDYLDIIIK